MQVKLLDIVRGLYSPLSPATTSSLVIRPSFPGECAIRREAVPGEKKTTKQKPCEASHTMERILRIAQQPPEL